MRTEPIHGAPATGKYLEFQQELLMLALGSMAFCRQPPAVELQEPMALETVAPGKADISVVRTGRTGRNAPCPCGSGRKFKRCCYSRKVIHP